MLKEFQVIGRKQPTEKESKPKLFRMTLFAKNDVVAKSRFFYFLKQVSKVKKTSGEIVAINEIHEKKPKSIKNFGIWLRYNSRSGTHNMYKEYRELTRIQAVVACYTDMAARHRARYGSIQIIKVATVTAADVRRPYIRQFINADIKFPLPHRVIQVKKEFKQTFSGNRPNTHA